MSLEIKTIKNIPIDSNCFVVSDISTSLSCLVIDPGTADCRELIDYIEDCGLKPEYAILTHEHFDHIGGVELLRKKYNVQLIASKLSSEAIVDRKKNMSFFYDGQGFITGAADITIEKLEYRLVWNGYVVCFLSTPGHTRASICFCINEYLFTGDTIIKDLKTITKLPTGCVTDLVVSMQLIREFVEHDFYILKCGHGENMLSTDLI